MPQDKPQKIVPKADKTDRSQDRAQAPNVWELLSAAVKDEPKRARYSFATDLLLPALILGEARPSEVEKNVRHYYSDHFAHNFRALKLAEENIKLYFENGKQTVDEKTFRFKDFQLGSDKGVDNAQLKNAQLKAWELFPQGLEGKKWSDVGSQLVAYNLFLRSEGFDPTRNFEKLKGDKKDWLSNDERQKLNCLKIKILGDRGRESDLGGWELNQFADAKNEILKLLNPTKLDQLPQRWRDFLADLERDTKSFFRYDENDPGRKKSGAIGVILDTPGNVARENILQWLKCGNTGPAPENKAERHKYVEGWGKNLADNWETAMRQFTNEEDRKIFTDAVLRVLQSRGADLSPPESALLHALNGTVTNVRRESPDPTLVAAHIRRTTANPNALAALDPSDTRTPGSIDTLKEKAKTSNPGTPWWHYITIPYTASPLANAGLTALTVWLGGDFAINKAQGTTGSPIGRALGYSWAKVYTVFQGDGLTKEQKALNKAVVEPLRAKASADPHFADLLKQNTKASYEALKKELASLDPKTDAKADPAKKIYDALVAEVDRAITEHGKAVPKVPTETPWEHFKNRRNDLTGRKLTLAEKEFKTTVLDPINAVTGTELTTLGQSNAEGWSLLRDKAAATSKCTDPLAEKMRESLINGCADNVVEFGKPAPNPPRLTPGQLVDAQVTPRARSTAGPMKLGALLAGAGALGGAGDAQAAHVPERPAIVKPADPAKPKAASEAVLNEFRDKVAKILDAIPESARADILKDPKEFADTVLEEAKKRLGTELDAATLKSVDTAIGETRKGSVKASEWVKAGPEKTVPTMAVPNDPATKLAELVDKTPSFDAEGTREKGPTVLGEEIFGDEKARKETIDHISKAVAALRKKKPSELSKEERETLEYYEKHESQWAKDAKPAEAKAFLERAVREEKLKVTPEKGGKGLRVSTGIGAGFVIIAVGLMIIPAPEPQGKPKRATLKNSGS